EGADAGGAAVAREEQLLLLVDEDAGDAGQFHRKRAQVATGVAVEHLDPVGACVGDVDAPTLAVDVGVVEAPLRSGRDRDEADPGETHLRRFSPALATSFWHQA